MTENPARPSSTHHSEPGTTEDGDHYNAAIESLRLNYAFFDPSGGIPSPLPLIIPRALLRAPTADLRSILREKLEAEDVSVRQRDIRFWRTKQPLQIANALDDRDVWIQKEGEERKFTAIAFTESLFSSLGEWLLDEKLLHLIVTGGDMPCILEPATPDPFALNIRVSAPQAIKIGTWAVLYTISPHYCYPPSTPAALQCGVADSQYFHPRKLGRRYTKQSQYRGVWKHPLGHPDFCDQH
ncbi:hypothetical protein BKA70DRAFT_409402 [Coprinopsis sp. MPI-PUGE-AT-0042]|nr:hypothetical protein BKA70DRAFT_409402 [Coprinopsis sp. MPI-PUGE-AT-0042]